jgi:molybdopterin-guanine dinucleotide biosynthesis protein A
MIPAGQLTGAVLAGGHSRRMGADKALLPVHGRSLWLRQVKLLQAAGASTVGVVRRPGQPALPLPADVPLWIDRVTDAGPLAGLQAALAASPTDWLAVVAVDLPRLEAAWFIWLAESCAPDRGAIVRHPTGEFEPLAAIYPRVALNAVGAQLRGPDFSLQRLAATLVALGHLAPVPVPENRREFLQNWNTPADVDPAAAS